MDNWNGGISKFVGCLFTEAVKRKFSIYRPIQTLCHLTILRSEYA